MYEGAEYEGPAFAKASALAKAMADEMAGKLARLRAARSIRPNCRAGSPTYAVIPWAGWGPETASRSLGSCCATPPTPPSPFGLYETACQGFVVRRLGRRGVPLSAAAF